MPYLVPPDNSPGGVERAARLARARERAAKRPAAEPGVLDKIRQNLKAEEFAEKLEDRAMIERDEAPPIQPARPNVSPNYKLKNAVAARYDLTPEARTMLYDSDVKVNYGAREDNPLRLSNTVRASYLGGDDPEIDIYGYRSPRNMNSREFEDSLMHEYAHLWNDQALTADQQSAWREEADEIAPKVARDRWSSGAWDKYYGESADSHRANEYYAMTAQYNEPVWRNKEERYDPLSSLGRQEEKPLASMDESAASQPLDKQRIERLMSKYMLKDYSNVLPPQDREKWYPGLFKGWGE